jgi:asparagine synthase (glutamine-hydrolysing)
MPGLVGIISREPHGEVDGTLDVMVEAMRHEPFYGDGRYSNRNLGLYVGWMCRQEGVSADCVPLINDNKDVILIFYGETYVTGQDATGTSCGNNTGGPAHARSLVELYEKVGEDFVRQLNGWFCGVIADLRRGKIILFNDRYGMSRLYVYEGKNEILFGSEAKSLLKVRPELRAIDPVGLAQFLRCNCVMENRTLFKDIALLPGASLWSFDGQSVKKRSYFDFKEWEQQEALPPDDFYEKFACTMNQVVPAYAGNVNQVALSLTAGLDTRVVMASLHMRDRSFPCYTFGGILGETFDIAIGRKLAAVYHQPYQTIKLNGDFFKSFADLAERTVYISDGNHNAFGAHDLYFNRIARKIAPTRLTGKYGSEVVRARKLIPFWSFPMQAVTSDLRPFLQRVPPPKEVNRLNHSLSKTVAENIPWFMSGRVAIEQSQLAIRTPYMDNALVKLLFQTPRPAAEKDELQARYVNDYGPELKRVATDMGKLGTNGRVVRALVPRLQRILAKKEYIYLYAMPHWLTRVDRSLGFLHPERLVSGRHKYEFYRIWAATHLADFIRGTLLNPRADYTGYFDYGVLSKMVKRHTAGTHNYLNEIDKALTIELVCSSLLRC